MSVSIGLNRYFQLFFDRGTHQAAPLGPGSVVFADVGVAEQLGQNEPGMGRKPSSHAVGDNFSVGEDAQALDKGPQLIGGSERSIVVDGGHAPALEGSVR